MAPLPTRLVRPCVAAAAAGLLLTPALAAPAYGAPTPEPSASTAPSRDAWADFPALTRPVTAKLDAAIQKVLRVTGVPGVIVGLWAPGKGSYVRTFGVADKATGAPMKTDFNMRIGSETKTFTVTALLELVDQGKLKLDDTIGTYISGVPNGNRITLRELAGMRSGLFNYSLDADFNKALAAGPTKPFTPQQLLDYSFRHPVQFEPNAQWQYSNTNLILLGLVVEKVGGKPIQEFIRQEVLEPAGLRRTVFPTDAHYPDPHPQGYTNDTTGKVVNATDWDPSWAWAAGAMISDLRDLRSWARTLATGTLLTPATQAERLKTTSIDGIPGARYGLGIFDVQGWIGHNGSLPGYQSLTVYLPEARATMVVLLNTDIGYEGQEPSTLFGEAITSIVTPGHVYPGHVPVAHKPAGPAPTGSTPAAPAPTGSTPAVPTPTGSAPAAPSATGPTPAGPTPPAAP